VHIERGSAFLHCLCARRYAKPGISFEVHDMLLNTALLDTAIMLTDQDYNRLKQLLAELTRQTRGMQAGLETLEEILDLARVVQREKMPVNVVTMNSRVMFEDVQTLEQGTVTIVYPTSADPSSHKISILSPVGAALIGESVGAEVALPLPHGQTRRIRLLDILYQPEAQGDLEL
jgi:regulator of nucleoside diphosphate kinase